MRTVAWKVTELHLVINPEGADYTLVTLVYQVDVGEKS